MSFSLETRRRQDGAHGRFERTHGGKSVRHPLALEVRDRPDAAVLAHEESDAQRVRRRDDAQLLEAFRQAVMHLHRVGDADLGLAAVDHGDDHLVSGGRLHEHVQGGLFLEHLRHRRGGGVVERAGLQRGEAVGLRPGTARGRAQDGAADQRACERSRRSPRTAFDDGWHGLPSVGVFEQNRPASDRRASAWMSLDICTTLRTMRA